MKQVVLIAALTATGLMHAQAITEYRYWINDDPSTLVTTSINPVTTVQLNATLSLPALTSDFNTVTVQMKDSSGEFSVPYTMLCSKGTGALNGYEYWIDDAIVSSTSGTIGPYGIVDLITDLQTGTSTGTHFFTIRFSSVNGTWSVPLTTQFDFITGIEELPGLSDLLLFPNPTDGQLALRLSTIESQRLKLAVLDATGHVVRVEENWTANGIALRTWDLSDLPAGTYGLRIGRGDQQATLRFVKN